MSVDLRDSRRKGDEESDGVGEERKRKCQKEGKFRVKRLYTLEVK